MRPIRLALLVALLVAVFAPAAAARGFTLGFNPDPVLYDISAPSNSFWIAKAHAEGGSVVRLNVDWGDIAPAQRPAGFVASNPASHGYNWSLLDAQIRKLTARGLQVMLNITFAPTWAEGAHRPGNVQPGTWEPNPAQFAQFATAAARRYDGSFSPPSDPSVTLPRVRYWQVWNEPNLDTYLTPQWTRTRHGFAPASPGIYRSLLNAFYGAVKSVSGSNTVVTAGIAPYGNAPGVNFPGGYRMHPLTFDRVLLSRRLHFDVLAQNVYPIGGPLWQPYDPGDVSVSNMYQVANLLRAGERAGHVAPRGGKQLWITEFAWNSSPPNPQGVPVGRQARWYEQSFYELWRQGVDAVLLLQLVDSPPIPNYASVYESGLYYLNGRPKPAATAFRFPFVTTRLTRARVLAWGRAPAAGWVSIERLSGGRWKTIAAVLTGSLQVFEKRLAVRGHAVLRAQVDGQTSLTWTQSG